MALSNNDLLKRDVPQSADWFVVSDDGLSALRISDGLQLGETPAGILVLNPQSASQRWLEFDLGEVGAPSVRLVATDRVMLLDDGTPADRYPLSCGVVLKLPGSTLHVGRDIAASGPAGPVLRIESARAPAGAPAGAPDWQALMGDIVQQEAAPAPAPDAGSPYVPGGRGRARIDGVQPVRSARARARAGARRGRWRAALAILVVAALGVATALAVRFPATLDLEGAWAWLARALVQVERPSAAPPAETTAAEIAAEAVDDVAVAVPPEAGIDGEAAMDIEAVMDIEPVMEIETVTQLETGVGLENPTDLEVESAPSVGAVASDDWRLVQARLLIDQGRITFPPEGNAVALLSRVLADQPDNAEALAMLGVATHRLLDAAARAHAAGDPYEARNLLEEVLGFNPYNQRANRLWAEWVDRSR